MLADPEGLTLTPTPKTYPQRWPLREGRFTAAMGMTLGGKVVSMLGNKRAYRYAVIVDGGVIAGFQLDETGINNTKAENLLAILSKGCAE